MIPQHARGDVPDAAVVVTDHCSKRAEDGRIELMGPAVHAHMHAETAAVPSGHGRRSRRRRWLGHRHHFVDVAPVAPSPAAVIRQRFSREHTDRRVAGLQLIEEARDGRGIGGELDLGRLGNDENGGEQWS